MGLNSPGKRLQFSWTVQDVTFETLITNIALGWFLQKVDIAPYNSRGTIGLINLFHEHNKPTELSSGLSRPFWKTYSFFNWNCHFSILKNLKSDNFRLFRCFTFRCQNCSFFKSESVNLFEFIAVYHRKPFVYFLVVFLCPMYRVRLCVL